MGVPAGKSDSVAHSAVMDTAHRENGAHLRIKDVSVQRQDIVIRIQQEQVFECFALPDEYRRHIRRQLHLHQGPRA